MALDEVDALYAAQEERWASMSEALELLRGMRVTRTENETCRFACSISSAPWVANTRGMLLRVGGVPAALDLLLDLYAAQVRGHAAAELGLLSRGDERRAIDRVIAFLEADAETDAEDR